MSRPPLEVADILRVQGDCFREQNRSWLGYQQLSALRAITACRTAALGGHLDSCSRCDLQAIWKDYAHGNKQCIMTLTAIEFLRRFCQHVLPRGFVRIRHFGYLASAHRTSLLALARLHLKSQPQPNPPIVSPQLATWRCPRCGANMRIGPNLTSQQGVDPTLLSPGAICLQLARF